MRTLAVFFLLAAGAQAQDAAKLPKSDDLPSLIETATASYMKGDYAAAVEIYRQAESLVEQTPPENPQRYDILKRLVSASAATGNYAMAIAYLQQAIDWRTQIFGKDDPKILSDLVQSSGYYRANGDYNKARLILGTVLAAHMKSPGPESIEVADDHSRMGLTWLDQKRAEPAIAEFEQAIVARSRAGGPMDVSVVPDLDRVAGLYNMQSEYTKAEPAYRRALVIRESLLGANDPDLITSVDGLAYALFGEKNYDAAEAMYKRLLGLWEKSVGKTHPMMAMAWDKVAIFYATQKRNAEAMDAFDHANAVRANFLAIGLQQEAAQSILGGNLKGAVPYYERALSALDPPNALYDELRATIAENVKQIKTAH